MKPNALILAAAIVAVLLAASFAQADIAPYPNAPGLPMKWIKDKPAPEAPAPETEPAPAPAPEVDALVQTLNAATMPQLHYALVDISPDGGEAARAFMRAIYQDRLAKQQSGQLTEQETRQLGELRQMADDGLLDAPAAP